jgi:hypothetical protein
LNDPNIKLELVKIKKAINKKLAKKTVGNMYINNVNTLKEAQNKVKLFEDTINLFSIRSIKICNKSVFSCHSYQGILLTGSAKIENEYKNDLGLARAIFYLISKNKTKGVYSATNEELL